jgi:hypothetical protein
MSRLFSLCLVVTKLPRTVNHTVHLGTGWVPDIMNVWSITHVTRVRIRCLLKAWSKVLS